MPDAPITAQATFCATVVDEWVRCGITDAVVAPGSRSTPLAIALVADDRLRVHVHHDERSAGFLALGLAQATGSPAPVLTTSGTATVELHPAVVEAHHGRVPMVCVTADRPPELQQVRAPQTIDQTRLYGVASRWFADPGPVDAMPESAWRSLGARAVAEALGPPAGPVHLNLGFRDPLVARPGELPPGRPEGAPWHRRDVEAPHAAPRVVAELAATVAGRRGVIVAGGAGGGRALDPIPVHALARSLGWPVLADPRSGCRTDVGTTVSHADALLRHAPFAERHRPDVVLQLGEPPASKVLAQWLTTASEHLVIDPDGTWADPDRRSALIVAADPSHLAAELAVAVAGGGIDPGWLDGWAEADAAASTSIASTLALHPSVSEPGIARDLLAALSAGSSLIVSSSMPVRDLEWYGAARSGVRVLANRGANGIDGVVSTAVGVALAGSPTALLIGDVAVLHDSNGLLGLMGRGVDLVLVVVDNDGGGIFSFLPQAELLDSDRFEQLFGTPHGIDLAALAAVHDIPTTVAEGPGEVTRAVVDAQAAGGVHLVVARTERHANVALHDELHAAVADALG
ncbi:MAG: 2-succinyl-5-enolpyruvyl-6-hydroxy-3-cyclohexene-1-carboxylic-acid synthase [Acidimicrobiales bacterium]